MNEETLEELRQMSESIRQQGRIITNETVNELRQINLRLEEINKYMRLLNVAVFLLLIGVGWKLGF